MLLQMYTNPNTGVEMFETFDYMYRCVGGSAQN